MHDVDRMYNCIKHSCAFVALAYNIINDHYDYLSLTVVWHLPNQHRAWHVHAHPNAAPFLSFVWFVQT